MLCYPQRPHPHPHLITGPLAESKLLRTRSRKASVGKFDVSEAGLWGMAALSHFLVSSTRTAVPTPPFRFVRHKLNLTRTLAVGRLYYPWVSGPPPQALPDHFDSTLYECDASFRTPALRLQCSLSTVSTPPTGQLKGGSSSRQGATTTEGNPGTSGVTYSQIFRLGLMADTSLSLPIQ